MGVRGPRDRLRFRERLCERAAQPDCDAAQFVQGDRPTSADGAGGWCLGSVGSCLGHPGSHFRTLSAVRICGRRRQRLGREKSMSGRIRSIHFLIVGVGLTATSLLSGPASLTTPLAVSACGTSVDGLCAIPPPMVIDVGSQTDVTNVGSVGTEGFAACPQLIIVGTITSNTATCGGGGSTQASNLSCATSTVANTSNNTPTATITCNQSVTLSYSYGWDYEAGSSVSGVNLQAGRQYPVSEPYAGPNDGQCHNWAVAWTAQSNSASQQVSPTSGYGFC
jgi:hypothetical protein